MFFGEHQEHDECVLEEREGVERIRKKEREGVERIREEEREREEEK